MLVNRPPNLVLCAPGINRSFLAITFGKLEGCPGRSEAIRALCRAATDS